MKNLWEVIFLGQIDVINVLEKADKPMSRTQIAKELDDSPITISNVIKVLLKHEEIKCIELDRYQSAKLLNWKNPIRRTRFYYVGIKFKGGKKWQE